MGALCSQGLVILFAADIKHRMAEREAAKVAEDMRHIKEQEKEQKKAVMDEFQKPFNELLRRLLSPDRRKSRLASKACTDTSCARLSASPACLVSRVAARKPLTSSRQFIAGSPKASTRRRQQRSEFAHRKRCARRVEGRL